MPDKEPYKRKSLGYLRIADKTKPRSPDLKGKLPIHRDTLKAISDEMTANDLDEIDCSIAGWFNTSANGKFISLQLSLPWSPASRPTEFKSIGAWLNGDD
jgi:hypothetical protein